MTEIARLFRRSRAIPEISEAEPEALRYKGKETDDFAIDLLSRAQSVRHGPVVEDVHDLEPIREQLRDGSLAFPDAQSREQLAVALTSWAQSNRAFKGGEKWIVPDKAAVAALLTDYVDGAPDPLRGKISEYAAPGFRNVTELVGLLGSPEVLAQPEGIRTSFAKQVRDVWTEDGTPVPKEVAQALPALVAGVNLPNLYEQVEELESGERHTPATTSDYRSAFEDGGKVVNQVGVAPEAVESFQDLHSRLVAIESHARAGNGEDEFLPTRLKEMKTALDSVSPKSSVTESDKPQSL